MPTCGELLEATPTLADHHRLQRLYTAEGMYLYPRSPADDAHNEACLERAMEKLAAGEGRYSAEQQQLWEEFYGEEA